MVQATNPQLVLYVAKSDQATYNDRAQLTAMLSNDDLDDLLIGLQSEIPPSGGVSWSSPNLTFSSSNGGSAIVAVTNTTTQQAFVNAIVAAKVVGGASALFLKDDSSPIQAPTVDQARALYGISWTPSNRKVADYLGTFTSLGQGKEVIFQNSSGDEVTFMDGNVTPGVISGGAFVNGDGVTAATITFQDDLSGYNFGTNSYSTFRFQGAAADTAGTFATANGVTTFTASSAAAINDSTGAALSDGAMSLSFDNTDVGTHAVVDSTAASTFQGTAGWYGVDVQNNVLSTSASNPAKYLVVNNPTKGAIQQPAVTINSNLGAYINANFGNGGRDQLPNMGFPGIPATDTVNYGSQVYGAIDFNQAGQSIEALRAVRKSYLTNPSATQLRNVGGSIPLSVFFQLSDVYTWFTSGSFTANNYGTWAPAAEAAVPEAEANIIQSPLGYYRANKTTQHAASNIIAMAIIVGSSSPSNLSTLATFLGTNSVNVDQYDPVDGTFNQVSITPTELWSRVQSGYTPERNLQADQWTIEDIVQFGKDIGRVMNLTASATSGVKTTFASLGATAKSELAKDVLQSYVDGTKSAVMKVVEALYNAGATSGSMDLNLLAYNLLGGTASVNSPFTASNENKMLSQAISVYLTANPSKALLADSLVTDVLVRGQLMKQDKPSSDPWSAQCGLRIGASGLGNGTVYNFTAPTQDANGTLWNVVPATVKVAIVGAVYHNLIGISSFSYNTKEKASLLYNLVSNFLGGNQSTNVWSELEKHISDKGVFKELIREKASSATNMFLSGNVGGQLPLGLSTLFTGLNNTANTPEERDAMLDAAVILLLDFVDIQTTASTASSNMTTLPRATPSELAAALATLFKKGSLAAGDMAAYMRALADMAAGAESDFQSIDLDPVTEATYNTALSTAIVSMASAVGSYTTNSPSTINASEMTGSWANSVRYVETQLTPFLKHVKADLTSIISGLSTFTEYLIIMEFVSEDNIISPEQAQALIAAGIPSSTVKNAMIAVPVFQGRALTDTVLLRYV
jgi:hypothetical protein